jgi:hypothetical protein
MTTSQWIGLWLIVAAAVVMTATVAIVVVGLATVLNRRDERRGGCRGEGCRREAGRHGCTRTRAVDGPAARDLATLARAGRVDRETVRKWEGE